MFGTAAAFATSGDGRIMLWGGNGNQNGNTRYTGGSNDKDVLLITTLGGNSAGLLTNIYSRSDYNMNKNVRFTGGSNDKDFLLINILSNSTIQIRTQALPN